MAITISRWLSLNVFSFARLVDFVEYMENDPYDLLFARNVRVSQGNTTVNKAIAKTFVDHPEQFAYSSNGLTLLCEGATHNPGSQELRLVNPRVVNGGGGGRKDAHALAVRWCVSVEEERGAALRGEV